MKKSLNEKFLLSIITVTYNAADTILNTLQSIEKQKFQSFELILVDGESTDNTVEILSAYKHLFNNVTLVVETDKGIYDAMNKGVSLSHGQYIIFMNSGDTFYDDDVLLNVVKYLDGNIDVVYGDVNYGGSIKTYPDKLGKLFFLSEKMVCHQSIIASKESLISNPFDITYKYCADRDWLYKSFLENRVFLHVPLIISNYNTDGVSSNIKKFQKDSIKLVLNQFGLTGVLFVLLKRYIGRWVL